MFSFDTTYSYEYTSVQNLNNEFFIWIYESTLAETGDSYLLYSTKLHVLALVTKGIKLTSASSTDWKRMLRLGLLGTWIYKHFALFDFSCFIVCLVYFLFIFSEKSADVTDFSIGLQVQTNLTGRRVQSGFDWSPNNSFIVKLL